MQRILAEKSAEQRGRPRRLLQRRQVTTLQHQFKARLRHCLRELLPARRWCYQIFVTRHDQRRHAQLAKSGPDIVPAGMASSLANSASAYSATAAIITACLEPKQA